MLAHVLLLAAVSALSAVAAGVWARRHGHDTVRYAVLGALLGPLFWVFVWTGKNRPGGGPPRPPPPPDAGPSRPPQPPAQPGSMRRTSPVRRTTQKPRTPIGRR